MDGRAVPGDPSAGDTDENATPKSTPTFASIGVVVVCGRSCCGVISIGDGSPADGIPCSNEAIPVPSAVIKTSSKLGAAVAASRPKAMPMVAAISCAAALPQSHAPYALRRRRCRAWAAPRIWIARLELRRYVLRVRAWVRGWVRGCELLCFFICALRAIRTYFCLLYTSDAADE